MQQHNNNNNNAHLITTYNMQQTLYYISYCVRIPNEIACLLNIKFSYTYFYNIMVLWH